MACQTFVLHCCPQIYHLMQCWVRLLLQHHERWILLCLILQNVQCWVRLLLQHHERWILLCLILKNVQPKKLGITCSTDCTAPCAHRPASEPSLIDDVACLVIGSGTVINTDSQSVC